MKHDFSQKVGVNQFPYLLFDNETLLLTHWPAFWGNGSHSRNNVKLMSNDLCIDAYHVVGLPGE